jgi:hypothetical protein
VSRQTVFPATPFRDVFGMEALKTLDIQDMAQSLQYSFYAGNIYKK